MTRRTVAVERDGQTVQVDPRLADLLTAVWRQGVRTCWCRIANAENLVHVCFGSSDDAAGFLNAVTSEDEPDLPDAWQWRAEAQNRALDPDRPGTPDHQFSLRLTFPARDLPHVTATARTKAPPPTAA